MTPRTTPLFYLGSAVLAVVAATLSLQPDRSASAAPQATAAPTAGTRPAATAAAAGGRRGGRPGAPRTNPNLGPVPAVHAPVPNTLPGLLGKPIKWVSTAPLVLPQNDPTHFLFSIKDPTVSYIDGRWEIYATANMIMGPQAEAFSQPNGPRPARGGTFNMVHVSFKDWAEAPETKLFYMDEAGFAGYKCAPEMFYFTPQKKWYFTYQTQPPVYCTSETPGDPKSWSKPQPFFPPGTPMPNLPIDYHFIGDGEYMYMFFTGDDGYVYRSRTTYAEFPKGFSNPVYAIAGTRNTVFEAGFAYKIKGVEKYLFCVEGLGAGRYYSAFVADKLDGDWYPVEGFHSPEKPFAGKANMTFEKGVTPWSGQVSHGEMIRDSNDERMILDPNNLQFLYQGISDGDNRGDYGALAYKLGLLRAVKE